MKTGTWGVKGPIKNVKVDLGLVLVMQKRILRAVPKKSVKKNEILIEICPGKKDKEKMATEIIKELSEKGKKIKKEDILSALPAGGVKICKKV